MTKEPFKGTTNGVKFWGSNGWVEVSRDHFLASDEKLFPKKIEKTEGAYETGVSHLENFIEAVKTRTNPIATVEIGHRTCTVCTLANIAFDVEMPIKWDPKKEKFTNDSLVKSHRLFNKTYTKGYTL